MGHQNRSNSPHFTHNCKVIEVVSYSWVSRQSVWLEIWHMSKIMVFDHPSRHTVTELLNLFVNISQEGIYWPSTYEYGSLYCYFIKENTSLWTNPDRVGSYIGLNPIFYFLMTVSIDLRRVLTSLSITYFVPPLVYIFHCCIFVYYWAGENHNDYFHPFSNREFYFLLEYAF